MPSLQEGILAHTTCFCGDRSKSPTDGEFLMQHEGLQLQTLHWQQKAADAGNPGADLGDKVVRERCNLLQADKDDVPYVTGAACPGQSVVYLPTTKDDSPGLVSRQQPRAPCPLPHPPCVVRCLQHHK